MVTVRFTVRNRPRVCIGAPAARHAVDIVPPNTRSGGGVAQVEAHITGTVWKIEVAVGDTVEEGDTVVILESMKMEMPVEAEDEGTVRAILVEEGQSVSEGDALVELE
jgi:acetyl-CoA carboxylase biotin carboxyl carrier protein